MAVSVSTSFASAACNSSAKYFVPCSMDSSVPNELGDRPNDSLLCITSSAVPPLSTAIIASKIGTCSLISYSLAYVLPLVDVLTHPSITPWLLGPQENLYPSA